MIEPFLRAKRISRSTGKSMHSQKLEKLSISGSLGLNDNRNLKHYKGTFRHEQNQTLGFVKGDKQKARHD